MDTEQKEKLFGEVAVDLGFIASEELEKVLRRQKIDKIIGISKPLGAYFFEDGSLTRDQVDKILTIQEKLIAKILINTKTNDQPTQAAQLEFVTPAEKQTLGEIIFDEFNIHVNKLQAQTDVQQILAMIHPDNFRQFVNNAINNVVKIIEDELKEHGKPFDKKEVVAFLMSEGNYFRSYFDVFSNEYSQFQLQLSAHDKNVQKGSSNAGMVGGIIGCMVLGPLGAFLGGAIAGGVTGYQAKEELKQKYDHLINSYSQLCDHLNQFLTNIGNRTIHLVTQVRSGAKQLEFNAK